MKHQTLSFVSWTLIFVMIIGVVQIGLGIFQIYNPEQQAFELLSPEGLTSSTQTEKIVKIKNLLISRRSSLQNYIDTLPPERAKEFVRKVNVFIVAYDDDDVIELFSLRIGIVPTIRPVVIEKYTPPIEKPSQNTWQPNIVDRPTGTQTPSTYKQSIVDVFLADFFQSTLWIFDIIIDHDRIHPRGQMKDKSVILSANIDHLDELTQVLVHELAHVIDIYVLQKGGGNPDTSYIYYRISWEDIDTQKAGSTGDDFVSGYAATNQYEDFAEAFTFYLFHNQEFEKRSKQSTQLKQKYDFLKEYVFDGFYQSSAYEKERIPSYIWDTTKVELKENARTQLFP